MLNQSELCQSSRQRGVTRAPQHTERQAHIGAREASRAAAQSEAAVELLIELDRIGRIVREIERG